jgi:alpha-beta hydrolase superfamily lysophospholipase
MKINKKKVYRWVKIILLVYCAIGIALYYLQEKFLFHPKRLDSNYVFKFDQKFEEVKLPFNDTDTMSIVKFFPDAGVRKGIIVYYHGNMENIEHYANFAKPLTKAGWEVWMEDYPGFGKSTGEMTEQKLYDQAMQLKKMADAKYGPDSLIVYGKSLGTGIAAYVASNSNQKLLVLESPYYSIPALSATYAFIYPTTLMSTYKIPTYQYLQDVRNRVVIFHGTDDGVVPYRCAARLKAYLKPTDTFITVPDADHQNINQKKMYYDAIGALLF